MLQRAIECMKCVVVECNYPGPVIRPGRLSLYSTAPPDRDVDTDLLPAAREPEKAPVIFLLKTDNKKQIIIKIYGGKKHVKHF